VTVAELSALLGAGADPARVQLAVDGANYLLAGWVTGADTAPAPVTPATHQAGLELGHTLYERHAAVGGIFNADEIYARLPASLTRPIEDLLNADTHLWGLA
jgi:hypothetical protein